MDADNRVSFEHGQPTLFPCDLMCTPWVLTSFCHAAAGGAAAGGGSLLVGGGAHQSLAGGGSLLVGSILVGACGFSFAPSECIDAKGNLLCLPFRMLSWAAVKAFRAAVGRPAPSLTLPDAGFASLYVEILLLLFSLLLSLLTSRSWLLFRR